MPASEVNSGVIADIINARTPEQAVAAAQEAHKELDQDDIVGSINRLMDSGRVPFYRSKKFWMSIIGVVAPVAAQVLTGAVSWPVAIGGAVASIVGYLVTQGGVDKATTTAITQATTKIIISKMEKGKPNA